MNGQLKKYAHYLVGLIFAFTLLTGCSALPSVQEGTPEAGRVWNFGSSGVQDADAFEEAAQDGVQSVTIPEHESLQAEDVPEYDGVPYVVINDNEPQFSEDEIADESFEEYSRLDDLGRCGAATASVGQDLMPTEKRGSIGQVKPTGWQTAKYDFVDGKYLYNRCHLIGYQLTAENANEKNLITGTRYMNVEGMLPFENMVADYVKETDNHVMYRVDPVFDGDNLVASGVQMEAYSVEDGGEDISFNVFVYNVQPGVEIDYETGENHEEETGTRDNAAFAGQAIRGNSRSKIYHCPGQAAYNEMEDSRYLILFSTEEEAQAAGYRRAKR